MKSKKSWKTLRYKEIKVYYLPEFDGGGTSFGQDYIEVVRKLFGKVSNLCEFCSGPGFIGFSLLAEGLCDHLCLIDINPEVLKCCRKTIKENSLESKVTIYESDVLTGVPKNEKWDLVLGNPPHFDGLRNNSINDLISTDPKWKIHSEFYKKIKGYLKSDGNVLLVENLQGSGTNTFKKMIEEGSLKIVKDFQINSKKKHNLVKNIKYFYSVLRNNSLKDVWSKFKRTVFRPLELLSILKYPFYFVWSSNSKKKVGIYEEVACNICGTKDYRVIIKESKESDIRKVFPIERSVKGTQRIVKCNKCGLIYVNPQIKAKELIDAYKKESNSFYTDDAEERINSFKESIKFVEENYPNKGKILDIGTSAGFFLKAAKDNGWKCYGVEPNRISALRARKEYQLDVREGVLREVKFKDNFFDVVTLWDVLEHMTDPSSELKEVYRILKPGGMVVINYPDMGSFLAKITASKWWFIFSVHLFYFDQSSIKKILSKNGFDNFKFKKYWQKLSLEYLVIMFGLYSRRISDCFGNFLRKIKLNRVKIKYYAGQSTVLAWKAKKII